MATGNDDRARCSDPGTAESPFTGTRVTRTYRQTINAPPATVFPLVCPVREAEWLDGWRYRMLYSASGLVEAGAVFSTPAEGEADTVWIVTHYDAQAREVAFARFTPNSRTCTLTISVSPAAKDRSSVDIAYTYTGVTAAGNDFLEHFTEDAFLKAMIVWEESMNYFLKTGERLSKA
jgi:hypothetical protein